MLTLASNERIPLTATMRLLLEINHMNHCSPATVSRGGVIYINAEDVGWRPVHSCIGIIISLQICEVCIQGHCIALISADMRLISLSLTCYHFANRYYRLVFSMHVHELPSTEEKVAQSNGFGILSYVAQCISICQILAHRLCCCSGHRHLAEGLGQCGTALIT